MASFPFRPFPPQQQQSHPQPQPQQQQFSAMLPPSHRPQHFQQPSNAAACMMMMVQQQIPHQQQQQPNFQHHQHQPPQAQKHQPAMVFADSTETGDTTPFPVGTPVQRYFDSVELEDGRWTRAGWYHGQIVECMGVLEEDDGGGFLYRVMYPDGDEEEWDHGEVLKSLQQQQQQQQQPTIVQNFGPLLQPEVFGPPTRVAAPATPSPEMQQQQELQQPASRLEGELPNQQHEHQQQISQDLQPFPVGTKIRRFFESVALDSGGATDAGWYNGEVAACLGKFEDENNDNDGDDRRDGNKNNRRPQQGQYLYDIVYQDGDHEELEHSEVQEGVEHFQKMSTLDPTLSPHVDSKNNIPADMDVGARATSAKAENNDDVDDSSTPNHFTDCIEQVLSQSSAREEVGGGGGFTAHELSRLSLLCAQQATTAGSLRRGQSVPLDTTGFSGVPVDLLTSTVMILRKHVQEAELCNIFEQAAQIYLSTEESLDALTQWVKDDAKSRLQALKFGLEAANIISQIAITPGIDRRAVHEDALQAIIALFRLHMRAHAIPTLNETAHSFFQSPDDGKNQQHHLDSPPKKRRRVSSAGEHINPPASEGLRRTLGKELNRLYKLVASTFQLYYILMERMELLLKSMLLDDHHVLLITNAALQTFEIDCHPTREILGASPGHQMQVASIAILSTAFGRYPLHRETILEELFPLLLRIPVARRSLRVFRVRYTSASSTSLANLNDIILKPFWDNHGDNHCIQMVTALILSLIHACVHRPTWNTAASGEKGQRSEQQQQQHMEEEADFGSGLAACLRVSNLLIFELLKRCKRSRYGGGTSEYRAFMGNLVQDLLSLLIVPEYPAAEQLLVTVMNYFRQDIEHASLTGPIKGKDKEQGPENTYLSFAFDLLSKMCAVEARLLKFCRDFPLDIRTTDDKKDKENSSVRLACYCGSQDRQCLTLGCDNCGLFYHGKCIGLGSQENVADEWLCDSCRLGRIYKRELRSMRIEKDEESFIDDSYVMRHAFLSSLAHRKGVENLEPAVQFHFARWLDELHAKATKAQSPKSSKRILEELVNRWDTIEPNGEGLTDEGYNRMLIALFAKGSPMAISFRIQMSFIIKIMEDMRSPHLRKLSLKAIEKAAEGDDQLMTVPAITKAVSRRLTDETISVREAALAFVGNYVVKFPKVATAYQSSLIACLGDTGVSVRKRAIRIFQDVLLTNPHYTARSEACDAMLKRAAFRKEEDTVRDLIHELFTKLWLQDGEQIVAGPKPSPRKAPPGSETPGSQSQSNNIVTPTPGSQKKYRIKRVELAAEQMMEVVRTSGTGDHLEKLFKKLWHDQVDEERNRKTKTRVELSPVHLDSLVSSLFNLLLSIEENRAPERTKLVGKDLAATLRTVEIISGTLPSAVLPHMDTVLPYLKADNGVQKEDEAMIVSACCDIVSRASSVFGRDDLTRFAVVANDLRQIVYNFNFMALESAIRALSVLAHHPQSDHDSPIAKCLLGLARTFYGYLLKFNNTANTGKNQEKVRCNIERALTVLGLICKHRGRAIGTHCDDDTFELPAGSLPPSADLSWSNLILTSYQIIALYLGNKSPRMKSYALRALGDIFLAEPRLLFALEQIGLVDDIMSPKAPIQLQMEALDCWKKILQSEEKRIDAGLAKETMDKDKTITVTKRISGDQDGDSNLFGGVLTSHAQRLFEMVSDKDVALRLSSLELLALLLRQGLVNPNEAVPYLLALQGDVDNDPIRSLALDLLITEGEKRPDMIRQRVRAGVKQAYAFQRSVYPKKSDVSAVVGTGDNVECIFGRVYKECMVKIRKQRHGLISSLLGLFEFSDIGEGNSALNTSNRRRSIRSREGTMDLALLTFAAQILAHLPYTTADDPLFIQHKISSAAALQGDQILDKFNTLLQPMRTDNIDDWDDTNEDEDALEKAAQAKFPSRVKAAEPLANGTIDLKAFAKLCQASGGVVLLMRLKSYLCKIYKLSEIRCLEYDPKEKEKISDRNIYKMDRAPAFQSKIPAFFLNASKQLDADTLIRQYAEFRSAFREEMAATARAEEARVEVLEKASLKSKKRTSSASAGTFTDDDDKDGIDMELEKKTAKSRKRSSSTSVRALFDDNDDAVIDG